MISRAVLWNLGGRFAHHGISLLVSIVLARLLLPEQFGLVAMVMVVVSVSQPLMDLGMGAALIQRKEVTEEQYSTVFYFNILIGALFSAALYAAADSISDFYERPELAAIAETLSLVFVVGSFGLIQTLRATKAMDFRLLSIIGVVSAAVSGVFGIALALTGWGVWALVWQQIIMTILRVVLLWTTQRWQPMLVFSFQSLTVLFGFSSKRFLDAVLTSLYRRLDVILIGKLFSAATLGYYARAQTLNSMVTAYSSESLQRVFFVAASEAQDDTERLVRLYRISISIVAFVAVGIAGGLYLNAQEIIVLLFGENWLQSAAYFEILALGGYAEPVSAIMMSLLLGKGFAGKHLVVGLWKKVLGVAPLYVAYRYGVVPFLWANLVYMAVGVTLNMIYVRPIVAFSVVRQWSWILRAISLGVLSAGATLVIVSWADVTNLWLSLGLKCTVFSGLYLGFSLVLNRETTLSVWVRVRGLLGKR